uniref:Uncharacterized protein n=1 Tax=Siphoviridae sp. ctbvd11 TaxID=2825567 RepID=A0A8S5QCZ8_9CAUD|nr:MAG TPA: hypothetical protein [Siphoviridae sp. ctbvd11]
MTPLFSLYQCFKERRTFGVMPQNFEDAFLPHR